MCQVQIVSIRQNTFVIKLDGDESFKLRVLGAESGCGHPGGRPQGGGLNLTLEFDMLHRKYRLSKMSKNIFDFVEGGGLMSPLLDPPLSFQGE